MSDNKKTSCDNCQHFPVCGLQKTVIDTVVKSMQVDFDSPNGGHWFGRLQELLAERCMYHLPKITISEENN